MVGDLGTARGFSNTPRLKKTVARFPSEINGSIILDQKATQRLYQHNEGHPDAQASARVQLTHRPGSG